MEKLPGDYIAGFVDGEGCFALKFRRDVRHDRGKRSGIKPVYFYWDVEFAIVLRADDKEILEKIKETLGCGKISVDKRGMVRYSVNNITELSDLVVPFFNKHSLCAKKKFDFLLWREAVEIFKRNQRLKLNTEAGKFGFQRTIWNQNDLKRLKEIQLAMMKFKGGNRMWKWL